MIPGPEAIVALVLILGTLWLGYLQGVEARGAAYRDSPTTLRPKPNGIICRNRYNLGDPVA